MVKVKLMLATIAVLLLTGCADVKAYQKNKLNDSEMVLGDRKIQKTESNFESYREGASGANGGKVGGGCGCN
ncbi:MAG: DUF4266 domain-containing protein [Parafilimonas sp.]